MAFEHADLDFFPGASFVNETDYCYLMRFFIELSLGQFVLAVNEESSAGSSGAIAFGEIEGLPAGTFRGGAALLPDRDGRL